MAGLLPLRVDNHQHRALSGSSSEEAYRSWIYSCNDRITFVALTNRVVINAEFLSNQVHNPPLFRR